MWTWHVKQVSASPLDSSLPLAFFSPSNTEFAFHKRNSELKHPEFAAAHTDEIIADALQLDKVEYKFLCCSNRSDSAQ